MTGCYNGEESKLKEKGNMTTKRKGRTGYTDNEKEIFMNIMKTSEGGKFWKVIVESKGGTTNSSRHDVWVQVAKIFNESTGKNLDSTQIKALWGRIKIERKKKHDNKKYKEACAKTGSEVGLEMPPPAVVDDVDFGLNVMDLTLCGFNNVTEDLVKCTDATEDIQNIVIDADAEGVARYSSCGSKTSGIGGRSSQLGVVETRRSSGGQTGGRSQGEVPGFLPYHIVIVPEMTQWMGGREVVQVRRWKKKKRHVGESFISMNVS